MKHSFSWCNIPQLLWWSTLSFNLSVSSFQMPSVMHSPKCVKSTYYCTNYSVYLMTFFMLTALCPVSYVPNRPNTANSVSFTIHASLKLCPVFYIIYSATFMLYVQLSSSIFDHKYLITTHVTLCINYKLNCVFISWPTSFICMQSVYFGYMQYLRPRIEGSCLTAGVITRATTQGCKKERILDERIIVCRGKKKTPNTLSSGGTLVKMTCLILLNSECCHYLLVLKRISYLQSYGEWSKTVLCEYLSTSLTLHIANCSSPSHTNKSKYNSLQCVWKDYTQAVLSCDFNLPQKQFVTFP